MDETAGGGEGRSPRMLSEIITHVNQIEQKITSLEETLSESNDIQLVNKLDIINLKNEVDKLRMALPTINEEQIAELQELAKFFEKSSAKDLGSLSKRIDEIDKSMKGMGRYMEGTGLSGANDDLRAEIGNLKSTVANLSKAVARSTKGKSPVPIKMESPDFSELRREIEKLKNRPAISTPAPQGPAGSRIKQLESELHNLKLDLNSLAEKLSSQKTAKKPTTPQPADTSKLDDFDCRVNENQSAIREIQKSIDKLVLNVEKMGTRKPAKAQKVLEIHEKVADKSLQKQVASLARDVAKLSHQPPAKTARPSININAIRREIRREVEHGKKETVDYILKELKKMVSQ